MDILITKKQLELFIHIYNKTPLPRVRSWLHLYNVVFSMKHWKLGATKKSTSI